MSGFIKFDGIDGESADDKHKGWIDISSFSFGASSPGHMGSSGGGAGKVSLSDFTITMHADKASPKLFQYCCEGKHITKATLEMSATYGNAGELTYLKYEFKDVIVTGYSTGGSSHGGTKPDESVSFGFAEIKQTYSPFDSAGKNAGNVPAGWNANANKPA